MVIRYKHCFGIVRTGQRELRPGKGLLGVSVHLGYCELPCPNVIMEGQGIIGFGICAVHGALIDGFIYVVTVPSVDLLDTIDSIGQVFRGAFAICADGDNIPLGSFGLGIAARGFEPDMEGGPFFRLFLAIDRIQCPLFKLNPALDDLVRYRELDVIFGGRIVCIAGSQLVYRGIQLITGRSFGLLDGVYSIVVCAWEILCGKATVFNGVNLDRFARLIQRVLCAIQRGVALGCTSFLIHLGDRSPPLLPRVMKLNLCGLSCLNCHGLSCRLNIARIGFFRNGVCSTSRQPGHGDLAIAVRGLGEGLPGAVVAEIKRPSFSADTDVRDGFHKLYTTCVRPIQLNVCFGISHVSGGEHRLIGTVFPN